MSNHSDQISDSGRRRDAVRDLSRRSPKGEAGSARATEGEIPITLEGRLAVSGFACGYAVTGSVRNFVPSLMACQGVVRSCVSEPLAYPAPAGVYSCRHFADKNSQGRSPQV